VDELVDMDERWDSLNFVNVTMYLQYNNNIVKINNLKFSKCKKKWESKKNLWLLMLKIICDRGYC
jgi:hypothetical protein